MAAYRAGVRWTGGEGFASGRYSRDHELVFDGLVIKGSAGPSHVPPGTASADAADPEELFVASLASCHMLWFLDLARRAGLVVTAYEDQAEGTLGEDGQGRTVMTKVVLRPKVASNGTPEQLAELHHRAHEVCYIANSVRTEVRVDFLT